MNRSERDLDFLFKAYGECVEVPEASADFLPRLWQQIDARRGEFAPWGQLTRLFVSTAAALCLLLGAMTVVSPRRPPVNANVHYVDVLAEAHPTENLAAQGILPRESGR